ncbi:hypothetical protein RYX36_022680 [Vicia faba]
MQHQHRLLILYATQTGNALDAAERLAREAERRSCPNKLLSLHDYDPNLLPQEEDIIFVVSTTGQGDSPDSMKKYNFVAKKLDKRLIDLGGTTILERGFGDDQHPSGYEGTLDPWMSSLWRMLNTIKPEFLPNGPDVVIQDTVLIDQPKVQITYHNIENIESHFSTASDFTSPDILRSARSMHPGNSSSDKSGHPDCFLKMYDTGDVLEILPGQDSAAVDAFIRRCNLVPDSLITASPREMDDCNGHGSRMPVKLKNFCGIDYGCSFCFSSAVFL